MKTSRHRLLEYIQSHRIVTVEDLSRALQMTRANARHHLAILQEQGLVELVGQRPARGRGRPAMLYSLSEQSQGHNLDRLSDGLLQEFILGVPVEAQNSAFQRVAKRLIETHPVGAVSQETSVNLTQRLYNTVQQLNDFKYQARWEAHADAPRLILGHCPYASILPEHPELCRFDGVLLGEMLGEDVTQAARLARDPQGATYCMFLVGKS